MANVGPAHGMNSCSGCTSAQLSTDFQIARPAFFFRHMRKMANRKRKSRSMDDNNVYCICRKEDDGDFMVSCDVCREWFHGRCVAVTEAEVEGSVQWVCSRCSRWVETKIDEKFKKFKSDVDLRIKECMETQNLDHQACTSNNAKIIRIQEDLLKKMEAELQFMKKIENLQEASKLKDEEVATLEAANVKLSHDLSEQRCQRMETESQLLTEIDHLKESMKVKDDEVANLKAANVKLSHDLSEQRCQRMEAESQLVTEIEYLKESMKVKDDEVAYLKAANVKLSHDLSRQHINSQKKEAESQIVVEIQNSKESSMKVKQDDEVANLKAANLELASSHKKKKLSLSNKPTQSKPHSQSVVKRTGPKKTYIDDED